MKSVLTTLIAAVASIIVAWITAGEKVERSVGIISCTRGENLAGHRSGDKLFTFTLADCGGKLPDSSYVGFVSRTLVCGGTDNVETHQPPNAGVMVHGLKVPVCGPPNGHISEVSAIYIKAPR